MEVLKDKKQLKRNLLYWGLSLLIVACYILIDGLGMIMASFKTFGNSQTHHFAIDSKVGESILGYVWDQYAVRISLLVIAAVPIVYLALRFRIQFRNGNASNFKKLIPYLRVIAGVILSYYCLTLGTKFPHEMFTDYYSFALWSSFFRIIGAFAILAAFVIDWKSAYRFFKGFPYSNPLLFKALYVLFISVCSCVLVEFQIASKMKFTSNMFFFNISYWVIIQVLIILLTRSVKAGAFTSLGISYLIGLINDIVFQFRGNYVISGDLTVIRTAMEVAGNYKYSPTKWFWISLVILVSTVLITVFVKFQKNNKTNWKNIVARSSIFIVMLAGVFLSYRDGLLYNYIFGLGWDYNTNVAHSGYIPYFLSNMNSFKEVTLEGYEADSAEIAFSKGLKQEEQKKVSSPNIIIIQNEAFADLSVLYDIKTNKDYMPFIHSLTENTRKGYLNTSVPTGPTANTEFEILMRSTLQFLPYGTVPYTQYIHSDVPSAVQVLKNQPKPYHTVSYHSYYSSGYKRTSIYKYFGFDESFFEDHFKEDFPKNDIIRSYLSDSANYRRVESFYEEFRKKSNDPWFCFNVTIQNHGGYTQTYDPPEEDRVYVTNFSTTESVTEYLSLVKQSDDAFRELVEYFKKCDEPTIIAMYGDHQPAFGQGTLETLSTHKVGSGIETHYVPFVIWANFDIEESDTLGDLQHKGKLNTLSTNYFVSTVFDIAGVRLSDYDRYLLNLHERIPAVTALGVWDTKGNYYESPEKSPYAKDIGSLRNIQYNLLFDDKDKLIKRFTMSSQT